MADNSQEYWTVWAKMTPEERREFKSLQSDSAKQRDLYEQVKSRPTTTPVRPGDVVGDRKALGPRVLTPPAPEVLPAPVSKSSGPLATTTKQQKPNTVVDTTFTESRRGGSAKPVSNSMGTITPPVNHPSTKLLEAAVAETPEIDDAAKIAVKAAKSNPDRAAEAFTSIVKNNKKLAAIGAAGLAALYGVGYLFSGRESKKETTQAGTATSPTSPTSMKETVSVERTRPTMGAAQMDVSRLYQNKRDEFMKDNSEYAQAKTEAEKQQLFKQQFDVDKTRFDSMAKENTKDYQEQKNRIAMAQLANTLGQALKLYGAARSNVGAKYLTEFMTEKPADFSPEYDRALTEKKLRGAEISEERGTAEKEAAGRQASWRDLWDDAVRAEQFNVGERNAAARENLRAATEAETKADTKKESGQSDLIRLEKEKQKLKAAILDPSDKDFSEAAIAAGYNPADLRNQWFRFGDQKVRDEAAKKLDAVFAPQIAKAKQRAGLPVEESATPPAPGETVLLVHPDGRTFAVPAEQVEAALKSGYTRK